MDEQARRSARTRATIAFVLAGVLLVINVAAGALWREERRDRFERARIEFDQRDRGWMDGGPAFGGRSSGPGVGGDDQQEGEVDRGRGLGPNGQGGQMGPRNRSDQDGSNRPGPTSTTEPPQEGTS